MERHSTEDPELMRLLEAVESGDLDELAHMLMLEFDEGDLHKALHLAAQLGRHECFRILLSEEPDLNLLTTRKTSILMTAVEHGHANIVQQLLHRFSCDVNLPGQYGLTALHRASWQGHVDIASQLINSGANMAAKDSSGDTPLILAAQLGHVKVGHLMLQQGCNINQPGQMGMTPLMVAAENGRSSFVELLLSFAAGKDIAEKWLGNTALTLAAQKGHLEIVKYLLKAGADPSIENIECMAAIHSATKGGHIGCVRVLLECGVSPNVQNKHKCTPVLLAAESGHVQVLQFLVERGGKDPVALHRAAAKGHDRCVKFLLTLHYSTHYKDSQGNTPLILAARMGHLSTVQLLVAFGADIRIDNDLPLLEAVINGQTEVVNYLLEEGANASAVSGDGILPMYWASCGGHADCIKSLIKAGADPNIATSDKQVTPLALAIQSNHFRVVQALMEQQADINLRSNSTHRHFHGQVLTPFELAADLSMFRILAMLVTAGCDLTAYWDWIKKQEIPTSLTNCPAFLCWLEDETATLPALKVLCRRLVLNCLGGCKENEIKKLPLPSVLRNYLIPPNWHD